jgi:hypothetical protein
MVRKKQDVQVAISALWVGKRDAFLTKINDTFDRGYGGSTEESNMRAAFITGHAGN